jgi:hypothetical protein
LTVPAALVIHLYLISDQKRALVTGDTGGALHMYSMTDYCEVKTMDAHNGSVSSIAINENTVLTGGSEGREVAVSEVV